MFKFNGQAITFGYYKLKAISQSTIDPKITFVDDQGKDVKMSLPSSIGRRLNIKCQKVTKFVVDFPCCIAMLGGRIVAVDVPQPAEFANWQATKEWVSPIEKNVKVVRDLDPNQWLFDGQYAYRNDGSLNILEGSGFAFQPVKTYNLYKMDIPMTLDEVSMACLAYRKTDGTYQVTCPVTRASGGFLQLVGDVEQWGADDQFINNSVASDLALMDNNYIVNLKFVNYAAKRVTDCFGFESAEPLGLPLLMIEHRTMSIVSLPQSVQQTSPAPFKFTQGVAWIIGLFGRIQTIEHLMVVKSIMKMLLSKGNTKVEVHGQDDDELSMKQKVEKLRATFEGAPLIRF